MKKRKTKARVKGYWRYSSAAQIRKGYKQAYYVKQYLRKRPSKKTLKAAAKKRATTLAAKPKQLGGTSDTKYPLYWTWKVSALTPSEGSSKGVQFFEAVDPDEPDRMLPEYYHTKFAVTRKTSINRLHKLIGQIEETYYGEVLWQSFTLYQVGGPGAITEKHWIEKERYTDVESLP